MGGRGWVEEGVEVEVKEEEGERAEKKKKKKNYIYSKYDRID